jgi:hypothetical protein
MSRLLRRFCSPKWCDEICDLENANYEFNVRGKVDREPVTQSTNRFPPRGEALGVLLLTFFAFLSVSLISDSALGKTQILLGEIFVLVPAYLYVRWRNYSPAVIFRLRPVSWRIVMTSVMIGFAMIVVADELDRLMSLLLPFPEELAALLKQLLQARTIFEWVIIFSRRGCGRRAF